MCSNKADICAMRKGVADHDMEQQRKKKDKKSRYNKNRIALLAAAVIVIFFIFFVSKIVSGNKEKKAEDAASQNIETVEVLENDSEAQNGNEESKEPVPSDDNLQVAADVAQMDDAEDPQEAESMSEDGAGARSDISAAIKGANETGSISYGIDVAKWQGEIDWKQVADAGVEFAIIRAGYRTQKTGIISEDPLAQYNLQQAKEAGLKLGVYFFSTAVTVEEAREEAAWLISFIAQYPITYPVVYNCEGFQSSESRQYGLDNSLRTDFAIAFLDYVQGKGYTPMFYAAKNEMEGNLLWDTDRLNSKYKIWVSQYPDKPYPETAKSSYSGVHDMWQYTSQGTVPGIPKGVDMNVAYFSYSEAAEAVDDTPYEAVEADQEVLLNMVEVQEEVTAKIETNLRSKPGTGEDSTIVGKLKNGERATRTAMSPSGWSRLLVNGEKVYAVSNYLTTDLEYQAPPAASESKPSSLYQEVNETVTAKKITNLRTVASSASDDTIVAVLNNGETATRTGIGSNGWSMLTYNGQTVYAISTYLTTDMGYRQTVPDTSVFTDVNEQVTPKIECNLRTEPSTANEGTVAATIKNGDVLTRTGINPNTGWSRLDYNGQTVYAVSSYLTSAQ